MENFHAHLLRVLVVDDDQAILDLFREILSPKKEAQKSETKIEALEEIRFKENTINGFPPLFEIVTCQQGDEAVNVVKGSLKDDRPFAVIFMDVRISQGPDGIWVAEHIRALDQNVEIVTIAGNSDVDPWDIVPRVPPVHKLLYLQKPFCPKEIRQFAAALGAKWQFERELRKVQEELEHWIEERTVELINTNEQLEAEIEERKRIEEALRKSEERYRVVLETDPNPVVVYDIQGKVTYLNPAFSRVFGWTLNESIGRDINVIPAENLIETELIFSKIKHGGTISGVETYGLTKDGNRVDVTISGAGFFDSLGRLQGSVITFQDITERKRTEKEIRFIAYHDTLTGLPNRKSFYMRLEDKFIQSHSHSGEKRRGVAINKWALLFLDLDRFKYVNDTLGHDVGDELLKTVATRLQNCLRKSDYIFRLGGDEFTVILNDLPNDADVAKVAKKIREKVAHPYYIRGHELYITVSIGISIYPMDGDNVEKLFKNADIAMYTAKEEKQGYRFFTEEMNRKALERMMLESSLRNALQQNQFVIYYQPLVNSRNQIIGMEALLRWQHPELGLIGPAKFIPLAEETGAIIPIGKWVLYNACKQAKEWHHKGYITFYVSVNLSTRQLKEPDLVETVEQALEASGLPAGCLKLEVTESSIMEEPEQAVEKMKLLREKGVHFSIDDFGTGYSSLGYLKRFPIDTLKIDRSFVMDSTTNKDDQEIIKTIISMARNLNMSTVAEGVETQEQQSFLIQHGCHMMQGYYFGHPMPVDKFEALLQEKGTAHEE